MGKDRPGNDDYQSDHMRLIFSEGFSFSGFERNCLYLNMKGQRFKNISGVSGIDSITDGRAAVLADFDNDGDLDVFVTTIQGQGHLLFRNNVGNDNNFIRITLEGKSSGKDAFGAVVRVKTSQGVLTRLKSGGSGFLAQHDPRLLFGLGHQEKAQSVVVTWPSGEVQQLGPIRAGSSLKIVEGSSQYETVVEKIGRLPDPFNQEQILWSKLKIKKGEILPRLHMYPVDERVETGSPLGEESAYFLNLWATWCSPCRKEMPELQRLLPDFRASGIALVGVSLDQEITRDGVQAFAKQLGISYPLYMIDEESIGMIFGEEVFVPLSVLIDEVGRVVEVFAGWNAESEQRIHQLLESRTSHSR